MLNAPAIVALKKSPKGITVTECKHRTNIHNTLRDANNKPLLLEEMPQVRSADYYVHRLATLYSACNENSEMPVLLIKEVERNIGVPIGKLKNCGTEYHQTFHQGHYIANVALKTLQAQEGTTPQQALKAFVTLTAECQRYVTNEKLPHWLTT